MTEQAEAETEQRPVRMCDVCGGVDDHPRHVYAHAPGEGQTDSGVANTALQAVGDDANAATAIIDHIRDDNTTMRHMDCCREAGCPDGTCHQVTQGAEDLRGAALVNHLTREGN